MKYLECLDFSRRFLQSWQDVTRCDKMWQDMPSCPKLSTSGEEISMTQENWQKHAKTTVTYRKTWEWEEISWIKPCCIPVEVIHVLAHWILNLLQHVAMPAKRAHLESESAVSKTGNARIHSMWNIIHIIATCFSLIQFTGVWLSQYDYLNWNSSVPKQSRCRWIRRLMIWMQDCSTSPNRDKSCAQPVSHLFRSWSRNKMSAEKTRHRLTILPPQCHIALRWISLNHNFELHACLCETL